MKLRLFYVYEFPPNPRRNRPIGAWIHREDGGIDYAFNPDYPEDEKLASDVVKRMIVNETDPVTDVFLECCQIHMGCFRSATEIETHETDNYAEFYKKLLKAIQ